MYERQVLFRKQHIPSLVMKALLFVAAFLLCLLLTTQEASAYCDNPNPAALGSSGKCGDNVTYTLSSSGVLTISGTGAMYDYTTYYDNYEGNYEIYSPFAVNDNIKSIVINEGVTSIGANTFSASQAYSSVSLPSTLISIGEEAFSGVQSNHTYVTKNFTTITIPVSVKTIGKRAFYMQKYLKSVNIYGTNLTIEQYAFSSCGITTLNLNPGVKTIEENAFRSNSITNIVIPDTVTSIGQNAFSANSELTSVTIGRGVTSIGASAFSGACHKLVVRMECAPAMGSNVFSLSTNYDYSAEEYYSYCYNCSAWRPSSAGKIYTPLGSDVTGYYDPAHFTVYPLYTVEFRNYDGTTISKNFYTENQTFTIPSNPTMTDAQYTYVFTGWSPAVQTTCTANATYTAQYTIEPRTYSVVFKNHDGTILSSNTYKYGATVSPPATPTKASDKTYNYTFKSWSPTVSTTCKGNATYTAQFTSSYINYSVVFKNYDGSTISSKTYHYGDTVAVPSNPTRAADKTYTYAFTGWGKTVSKTCTGSVTYTAAFSSTYINYSVVFKDYDGTVISEKTDYHYGDTVYVPANPTRDADNTYTYAFTGWDKAVSNVTGSTTYVATYKSSYIEYSIVFKDWDDTVLSSKTDYHWGDSVTVPNDPARPQDMGSTYTFAGWDKEVVAVVGDAIYKATYTATGQRYTILFLDWNGTVLSEKEYYYGDSPEIPATPTREADEQYSYYFNGWNYAVTDVNRNKTYTATYTAIPNYYTVMFVNYDGSYLYFNSNYKYGDSVYQPTVTSAPPSDNDKLYVNVFSGWSPEFSVTCQGNAVYTAQFEKDYIEYPVVFKNWDGSVISSVDYHYGDTVTTPADPSRAADETYSYTFSGWDKTINTVCEEGVTYVALYDSEYVNYSVRFEDYDGATVSEKTDYHYGDSVIIPTSPVRESDGINNYSFDCWSPSVAPVVTGNEVYVAQYAANAAEHTVTFQDWNAYVISSDTYLWGEIVAVPDDPYRVEDDTYIYEFTGWSPSVAPTVSGSALYVAQYQPTFKEYTVTFRDYDGTEISSAVYRWGDTILMPNDPVRPQDENNVYAFAGWDKPVSATCAGNATYTAQYTTEERRFTVTFLDYDGSPLLVKTDYLYGDTVELPADPIRANDTNYAYTFAGWTPIVDAVMGNATYTATYTMTSTSEFEVIFVDYDGTVISTATYEEGETVVFPANPVRPDDVDNNISFTFAGWNYVVGANGDLTYIATYDMDYIGAYTAYTVIFEDYDGTELEVATYEQPEAVITPTPPIRESDNIYDYQFSGWVYEGGNTVAPMAAFSMRMLDAEGDSDPATSFVAVYAANYLENYRKYTVTFQDWNGTEISSAVYHWGDTVEVPADPTRTSDSSNTYTFAGWDKVVSAVDGNATYVATYTATPIQQESGSTGGTTGGGWWDDSYDDTDTEETPADEPTEEEPPAEDEETKDDPTEEESKETGEQENTEEPPVKENPAESEPENNVGEVVEQPTGDTVNNGAGKNNTPVIESKPSDGNTVEEAPAEAEDVTITYYDYYGVAHTHVIKGDKTKLVPSDVPERVMENGRTYEFKKWEISLDENGNRVYKPVYALVETEEAPLHNTPMTIDPGASGAEEDSDGEGDLSAVQIVAIVAASIVAVVGISAGVSFLHRRRN